MAEQSKKTTTRKPPTKPKHPGGRPTKLTRELVDKAAEYVQETDTFLPGSLLPTIERLSLILDISRETIYEWRDAENPTPLQREFSDIVSRLMRLQADKLLQLGLAGKYNPMITKLVLSKHDYTDKQQVDHTTNGKELPTPILGGVSQPKGK